MDRASQLLPHCEPLLDKVVAGFLLGLEQGCNAGCLSVYCRSPPEAVAAAGARHRAMEVL